MSCSQLNPTNMQDREITIPCFCIDKDKDGSNYYNIKGRSKNEEKESNKKYRTISPAHLREWDEFSPKPQLLPQYSPHPIPFAKNPS